jgi:transcriptional regulator with XRE-family HTH domain
LQAKNQTNLEFSDRTDRLADQLGISLRQLAERIGISPAMLFAYRSGKYPISRKAWKKLDQTESNLEPPRSLERISEPPSYASTAAPSAANALRAEIERAYHELLDHCDGDLRRLSWLLGRLMAPTDWLGVNPQVQTHIDEARRLHNDQMRQHRAGEKKGEVSGQ